MVLDSQLPASPGLQSHICPAPGGSQVVWFVLGTTPEWLLGDLFHSSPALSKAWICLNYLTEPFHLDD